MEGELGDYIEPAFRGMALTRTGGNTVLTGPVRDQAELQGLLRRLSDFGLTLLEAKAVDQPPDELSEHNRVNTAGSRPSASGSNSKGADNGYRN